MYRCTKGSIASIFAACLTLTACETNAPKHDINIKRPFAFMKNQKQIPPFYETILSLLQEGKYNEASSLINQSLQAEPKNVTLHLLNSVVYEKLAEHGSAAGKELAGVGYQNAINIDSSNVFAITQLGKLKYRDQEYDQAQEHFANALLIDPSNPDLWQELAAASYYNYDLKTALNAIDRAIQLKPNDPLVNRSAAMIYAALGDFQTSKHHLDNFVKLAGADPTGAQLKARYNDWKMLYDSGRLQLAAAKSSDSGSSSASSSALSLSSSSSQSSSNQGSQAQSASSSSSQSANADSSDSDESQGGDSSASSSSESPYTIDTANEGMDVLSAPMNEGGPTSMSDNSPQIIIDCYLLRISEDALSSKGNNILENLAVTLNPGGFTKFKGSFWGSGAPPIANASPTTNIVYEPDAAFKPNQDNGNVGQASFYTPGQSSFNFGNKGSFTGRIFTAGITWAGLTYSLNIANATDNRTEVVSRPSLMTFLHKPSVFFSGDELVNGFTGQYGGTLVKYPVGVTLEVTPTSLEGDIITLQVGLEGSLLTQPNPDLAQTVDVAKSRVDTFVKLRLGETLMLGGIYERLEVSSKSGFPGLQDIPVAQYFFANEATASRRRSVVFMLSPRSPDAVKAAVNRAMAREAVTPNLRELIARTPDWFHSHPNLVSIFRYMATDPVIYYEFRATDILPPSWGWDPPIRDKLDQIMSFAYF